MKTCATLFWSIVIPVVSFGCELWILKNNEIEMLRKFQRQIGQKCQRFPNRSPNHSAYSPSGWMRIDRLVQVKKLLFLRSITTMDEYDTCRKVLLTRARMYWENVNKGKQNESNSPIFDILNIADEVGLIN